MSKKLLFIATLVYLFYICSSRAYALDITVQLPSGSSTPTAAPTSTPVASATTQPVSPSPTVTPTIAPTITGTSTPSPSATVLPTVTAVPSTAPSSTPATGGVTQTSAPSSTSEPTNSPAPTPSPQITVQSILKTEPEKVKPIIKDIGDNAYNTLLDSPLSFLVGENTRDYYHPHGLSQSSTKFLLIIGFTFILLGLLLIKIESVRAWSIRLTGHSPSVN